MNQTAKLTALCLITSCMCVFQTPVRAEPPQVACLLAEAPAGVPFNAWRDGLKARGVILSHAFPPAGGLIVTGQAEVKEFLSLGEKIYADSPFGEDEARIRSTMEGDLLWHAQRKLLGPDTDCAAEDSPPGEPLVNDARPPVLRGADPSAVCGATSLKHSGSEYLLGSVSVNVILPESGGGIDTSSENWTPEMETTVSNEITEGLNDLMALYKLKTQVKPSFTYHYYFGRRDPRAQTSYEPIMRNATLDYNTCDSGEGLWACEVLSKLGYSTFSGYAKAREFNGDARLSDGTDWAYTIFVVNSLLDADGKFPDGWFAYAWIGGPWVVMTYDNDGWGISKMNQVVRHESCHIFYALDEYSSSGCACSDISGYVNYADENCENSCSSNVSCMMRDNVASTCLYTNGQMGWGDADGDSVPDPLEIEPETTLDTYSPDPSPGGVLTYTGTAEINKLINKNIYNYKCNFNILDISYVAYRVDGGPWYGASASDGSFDSESEGFTFTVGPLSPGTHTIEARASDEIDQADSTPASDTVTVSGGECQAPTAADPGGGAMSGESYGISWSSVPEAADYHLEEASTQDFAVPLFSECVEGTVHTFSHEVGSCSTYYYRVSSDCDGDCGAGGGSGWSNIVSKQVGCQGCVLSCEAGASPSSGQPPLGVSFTAAATAEGCSGPVSYSWEFGDGGSSAEQNPSHTYTSAGAFHWSMTAEAGGVSCVKTGLVTAGSGGCAVQCAAGAPPSAMAGTPAAFTASSETSNCSGPASYLWDFGDGGSSEEQNTSHAYSRTGTYCWYMNASADGFSCTRTGNIAVLGAGCSISCSADGPPSGTPGDPVQFGAEATPSGCSGPVSYLWDFGDGSTSADKDPAHSYASTGTFSWSVTAGADGQTCTKNGSITICRPPFVATMTKLSSPFRIAVNGSNMNADMKVFINGSEWTAFTWKKPTKIVLKGGRALKALVPRGVSTEFEFVNPDGCSYLKTWSW